MVVELAHVMEEVVEELEQVLEEVELAPKES